MEASFDEILSTITKFYLVGSNLSADDGYFDTIEGQRLLKQLDDSFENDKVRHWKNFILNLCAKLNRKSSDIKHHPSNNIPSFSASILIHEEKDQKVVFRQSIVIELSLLGPFYTLYGTQAVSLTSQGQKIDFQPNICISPQGVFSDAFYLLRNLLNEDYAQYKHVSFETLRHSIKDLWVPGMNKPLHCDATVYQALFNPDDITTYRLHGDMLYN